MNRLVQGDVGSGKTAVAAGCAWLAVRSGWQCAMMAPTEILAEQHCKTLAAMLAPAGIPVGRPHRLYEGGRKAKGPGGPRVRELPFVVGTHALLSQGVAFGAWAWSSPMNSIASAWSKEPLWRPRRTRRRTRRRRDAPSGAQAGEFTFPAANEMPKGAPGAACRAGEVEQRAALAAKAGGEADFSPNVLVMSATPIPRTLALIIYGDLDVSVIDALPLAGCRSRRCWWGRASASGCTALSGTR